MGARHWRPQQGPWAPITRFRNYANSPIIYPWGGPRILIIKWGSASKSQALQKWIESTLSDHALFVHKFAQLFSWDLQVPWRCVKLRMTINPSQYSLLQLRIRSLPYPRLWSWNEDTATPGENEVGHRNGQYAILHNYDLQLRTLGLCVQVENTRCNCSVNALSMASWVTGLLLLISYANIHIVTHLSRVQYRLMGLSCNL